MSLRHYYEVYHEGFRAQVEGWPVKPVDIAAAWLARQPADLAVADFGCGDAELASRVPQTCHNFDLEANNPVRRRKLTLA